MRKIFKSMFVLSGLTLSVGLSFISTLNKSNDINSNANKQIHPASYQNFDCKYEYIHTFSNKEFNFNNSLKSEDNFENNQILFLNEEFLIKFDSQAKIGEIFLDLYNFSIRKWYILKITFDNEIKKVNQINLKNYFKETLIPKIVSNWKNEVSKTFVLKSNIILSGENKLASITNNADGSFSSNIWKRGEITKSFNVNYWLDDSIIRKTILKEYDNDSFIIKSKKIKNFYILPLIHVEKPPIEKATWKNKSFSVNNQEIKINQNNIENILLPEFASKGLEWWRFFTNGYSLGDALYKSGVILLSSMIGVVTGAICTPWVGAAIGVGTGYGLEFGLTKLIDEYRKEDDEIKSKIKNVFNSIAKLGFKYEINRFLNSSNNVLNLWSEITYSAKSTAIISNISKAKLYSSPAAAEMEIEVIKYVQI